MFSFSQTLIIATFAISALAAPATTVNGNNNYNSGYLQNGDNINFSISNSSDVSGVYNIGSGNFNIQNSNIQGNTVKSSTTVVKSKKKNQHHHRD